VLFGKHVNKYYIKYGLLFLLGIIALIVVDIFQLRIPEVIGNIIDGLESKTFTQQLLKEAVLSLAIIALIMFIGRFLWRICIFGNGIRIESDLRNKMFKHMEKLSVEYYSHNKVGALMTLYTNDLNLIRQTFGMGTIMLVDALCLGVLALIKMFQLNIVLSIISLVSLILITVFSSIMGRRITRHTRKNFEVYGRLSDYVQETFSGISVVKSFVLEKIQKERFVPYNQENMNSTIAITKDSAFMNTVVSTILAIINITILGYGGYVIYINQTNGVSTFTIGDLTKFISFFGTLIWPIEAVGRLINLRSQGVASLKRVNEVLNRKPLVNDDLVDNFNFVVKGKIEYRNLNFTYPQTHKEVLSNISFTIDEGEFVGIIGGTGSGKTSLVDLLLRIYNIEENMLFIDDADIMHLPLKTVRDSISYVPQDNFLFSDTIENNIGFCDEVIDEDKVEKYANIASIKDDILEFKDKFKTVLGERGVTVSGGQKQRISISRALYKDAAILILDDSLSAVDTETEKNIINNLRKLRSGKTTIIIAHRITTLQNLDKIIVIEEGKITGVGTHNELIESNHFYSREVKLQELEKEAN